MDILDGSLNESYKTREYVMKAMDLAPEGSDLVIEVPWRAHPRSAYGMGLQDSPGEFVNISAAGLFHLNSVVVIYTD